MPRGFRRQLGYLMLSVVFVVVVIAVAILLGQTGSALQSIGNRFSNTKNSMSLIQKGLAQYASTHGRLPCPANPALDTGATAAGYPNQDSNLADAATTCTYPTGIVPWRALGLAAKDVTDEWGRMISYRVFDGAIGLTQAGGASKVYCDTTNGAKGETAPVNGLCSTDTNTLDSSFTSHRSYPTTSKLKGLNVSDFGTTVNKVAYILISHGPSGLGGYLPSGTRMTLPGASAGDYANVQSPTYYPAQTPGTFALSAVSGSNVTPGSTGHFDDVVAYVTIDNLAIQARLVSRDWAEAPLPTFSDSTAPVPGASPTTDPLNPRWTTTGATSAKAFTSSSASGQTVLTGPTAGQSMASCLWWPNLLTLNSVTNNYRQTLSAYVEFAAADNANDIFPGFTVGFLSGLETQPDELTCGTTGYDVSATGTNGASTITVANTPGFHEQTTATGSAGANTITVASSTGIVTGMNVTGTGVRASATVTSIAGTVITLSLTNSGAVSGTLTFTNIVPGMQVTGSGIGTSGSGTFATVSSISGSTVTLNRANTTAIATTVNFANSQLIQRDLGWAGGTLASYTNRFAVEFDANIDTASVTPPVTSPNDPALPHLAVDYAGVTHGTNAESCASTGYASPCDMPPATFSATTVAVANVVRVSGASTIAVPSTTGIAVGKSATGTGIGAGAVVTGISGTTVTLSVPNTSSGTATVTFAITATLTSGSADIVVSTVSGIVTGTSVTGTGIGAGATVSSISGTTVTLSAASTSTTTSTVAFAASSAANFMQSGLSVFNSMRVDVTPFACLSKSSSTGASGAFTLTVPDKTALAVGMGASGANIATGATIRSISAGSNVVTLTLAHTATVSTTVDFSLLSDITKSATGTAAASTITVSDTRWLGIGMTASGTGVGASATITDISGTTVTLSVPNSAAVSGTIAFAAMNPAKSGSASSGVNTVSVSDVAGVAVGMRALGDGIADGTTVTGISGTTLTLSANTTDAISGTVTLRPAQTQLKSWTLSNAGCNGDTVSCAALQNVSAPFSLDLSTNDQALSTLVCLDVPAPSTAFDTLYFGFTTASRRTRNTALSSNIAFRALNVSNPLQP